MSRPIVPLRLLISLLVLSYVMCLAATAFAQTRVVAGPIIGHVTDTSARLWMQLNQTEAVTVRPVDVVTNRPVGSIRIDVEGPPPFVFDAPVNGLQPNRNYRLEVLFDDKQVTMPAPEITLRTAPAPGEAETFCIAFGSCLNPAAFPQMPIFKTIDALKPRAFLFLGNTGNLPQSLPEFPQTRKLAFRFLCDFQRSVRNAPDLQPLFRSAAIYSLWDDHDFGTTGADRSFVYSTEARIAFMRYWPNPTYGTPDAPGIFCSFTLGDVDFFLLDDRTYRDPVNDKDNPPQAMLGLGQIAWLKAALKNSRAAFKVIATPSQMLPDYHPYQHWGHYPTERADFLHWLFDNKIAGVLLLSGDRQLAELSVRPPADKSPNEYPLYELTSSPLAQKMADDQTLALVNPLREGPLVADLNFATLDFAGPKSKRHVTLRIRDTQGKTRLEKVIFAGDLQPQP